MSAGYPTRTLAAKLGVKPDSTLVLVNAPDEIEKTLAPLPAEVVLPAGLVDSRSARSTRPGPACA